jgi:hypothetical protein
MGAFLVSDANSADGGSPLIGVIGFGLTSAGVAMQIDSHKWIRRGGEEKDLRYAVLFVFDISI